MKFRVALGMSGHLGEVKGHADHLWTTEVKGHADHLWTTEVRGQSLSDHSEYKLHVILNITYTRCQENVLYIKDWYLGEIGMLITFDDTKIIDSTGLEITV